MSISHILVASNFLFFKFTADARIVRLFKEIRCKIKKSHSLSAFSTRIANTDPLIVPHMRALMDLNANVLSLAQGIVNWSPPEVALHIVASKFNEKDIHGYASNYGLPILRERLYKKLAKQGITNSEVMVTSGANQAFTNLIITLLDPQHIVILFKPYYFNHLMALQMTGNAENIIIGEVTPDLIPDMSWLKHFLHNHQNGSIRMIVLCNPCNPTGIIYPEEMMQDASEICKEYKVWLVVDNTYDKFHYEDDRTPSLSSITTTISSSSSSSSSKTSLLRASKSTLFVPHHCIEGDHVVNIFSMSKVFGMMGWRVGYIAYPRFLSPQLIKVQDTIAICAPVPSQMLAAAALDVEDSWLEGKISSLARNKELVCSSLSPILPPLSDGELYGGTGAIYYFFRLPSVVSEKKDLINTLLYDVPVYSSAVQSSKLPFPPCLDQAITDWLALKWGVVLIPGSSCGMPGFVRICYANLQYDSCQVACERLRLGLIDLMDRCER